MRLLLDTRLFLWFLADSPRLKAPARRRIARAHDVLVSAASLWEASIKVGLGKLQVDMDDLVEQITASHFIELPVTGRHAAAMSALAGHHRDPFDRMLIDRMLIAQATVERVPLLTVDEALGAYGRPVELV